MDSLKFRILIDEVLIAAFRTYNEGIQYIEYLEEFHGINPDIIGIKIRNSASPSAKNEEGAI